MQTNSNSDDGMIIDALRQAESAARGYADFDTWPDRDVKDRGIGRDFAEALSRNFGIHLSHVDVVERNFDPPDLVVDERIGVELTELVDSNAIAAAAKQKRAGESPSVYRDWTERDLINRLIELIQRKDAGVPKRHVGLPDYWLVIHTDEPGLSPGQIEAYLQKWSPVSCNLLTRAFLLMSYFPEFGGRPLFELALRRGAA
jgi:hypothetical protein